MTVDDDRQRKLNNTASKALVVELLEDLDLGTLDLSPTPLTVADMDELRQFDDSPTNLELVRARAMEWKRDKLPVALADNGRRLHTHNKRERREAWGLIDEHRRTPEGRETYNEKQRDAYKEKKGGDVREYVRDLSDEEKKNRRREKDRARKKRKRDEDKMRAMAEADAKLASRAIV